MAFKMKSGNKPTFKNMGSSPVKQTVTGKSDDGIAKVDLGKVDIKGGNKSWTNTDTRLPINMPGGGDYDPTTGTATNTNADKRQAKREQFSSDVNNLIEGVVGIPGTIVESIGDVGSWVGRGLKKSKIKRAERKQNKIDNPKLKKVKKVKVKKIKEVKVKKVKGVEGDKKVKEKTTTKKSNNEIKVKGGASYAYNFNNKKAPESPNANDEYVKPKSKVRVASKKELKKMKPKSKVAKNLSKFAKSDMGTEIGTGVAVAGLTAGINALASRKEKTMRERQNIAEGFSKIKFGRKSRLTDEA